VVVLLGQPERVYHSRRSLYIKAAGFKNIEMESDFKEYIEHDFKHRVEHPFKRWSWLMPHYFRGISSFARFLIKI